MVSNDGFVAVFWATVQSREAGVWYEMSKFLCVAGLPFWGLIRRQMSNSRRLSIYCGLS
jgi:hypothetical protein